MTILPIAKEVSTCAFSIIFPGIIILNENPTEASISILVSNPKEEPNPITFWYPLMKI